jgi:hypothetical protein
MRRRAFIALLGAAAVAAWPPEPGAQQAGRMRRIGVLMAYGESDREGQVDVVAFREGLQKLGWAEGRNIGIDIRWATSDAGLMQRFAKEFVALQPDLVLSHATPLTATLLQETRTIPILFVNVSDPVGSGFVASLARPGGNVTGFVNLEPTMAGKWLELLKEIAPRVDRVAFLFNPGNGALCRILPRSLQSRRHVFRRRGDRRARSRYIRAGIRHCRTGTRAERRAPRDAGYLPECPSRGDHVARGSLPGPCRLSVPFLH